MRWLGAHLLAVASMAHAQVADRSEAQLPYFVPPPLEYAKEELAELKRAGISRNVAVLAGQVAEAQDRTAYLTERQSIARQDLARRQWLAEHERLVHRRQLIYSDVIFVVANVVVVLGLLLTVWQFTRDHVDWKRLYLHNLKVLATRLRRGSTTLANMPAQGSPTKIALRADGIEIGTRVTGLAILIISLGFYYLMLVHVYRIEVVSPASAPASQPAAK
jgi:hypothetical protein